MADEKGTAKETRAVTNSAIDSGGAPSEKLSLSGPVLEVQYHELPFREIGQIYVTKSKTITPPAGWQQVFVSTASWDLSYGHDTYEQALVSHAAASAGVRLTGTTLEVLATALMREPTGNPNRKWEARVRIQAVFLGR